MLLPRRPPRRYFATPSPLIPRSLIAIDLRHFRHAYALL